MNPLFAPLAPYLTAIKIGAACVVLSVVFFGGCRLQARSDSQKLADKDHTIRVLTMDKDMLADALNQVNAQADQAKRDAAVQAGKAADAVKAADKDRAAYDKRVALLGKKLADAMKDDACRVKSEEVLCLDLE